MDRERLFLEAVTSAHLETQVDAEFQRRGKLEPGPLLVRLGFLPADLAKADLKELSCALEPQRREVIAILHAIRRRGADLGLVPRFRVNSGGLEGQLESCYLEVETASQPDLFAADPVSDGLRGVRQLLLAEDWEGARARLQGLGHWLPVSLPPLSDHADLIDALVAAQDWVKDPGEALESRCPALAQHVEALLGARGQALLRSLYRRLAEALRDAPFDPLRPRRHASHAYALLGEPAEAAAALERDPNWHASVEGLRLHALYSEAAGLRTQALRDWLLLCFEHPEGSLDALGASRLLRPSLEAFFDLEPALPDWSFPAYALLLHRLPWPEPGREAEGIGASLLDRARTLLHSAKDPALARRAVGELCPALLSIHLKILAERTAS